MSSTDTPLGTLNMLQAKQKETQSPFIVLSGNKQGQSTSLSKTRRWTTNISLKFIIIYENLDLLVTNK